MTRRTLPVSLVLPLLVLGCPRDDEAPEAAAKPTTAATTATTTTPSAGKTSVTFISDDWEAAKKLAAAEGKLVFIDAWAPWCHTCWSMKRDVLHDESLARFLDRYVFLEIDTDRPENARINAQLPIRVWPTFFVVDPVREAIVAAHGGAMSLPETVAFLERGVTSRSGGGAVDAALADAYRLWKEGDATKAAERFVEVAKQESPRRGEAVHSAARAYRHANENARCTEVALEHLDDVQGSAALGDLASFLLICSGKLDDKEPLKQRAREAARVKLQALVDQPAAGASVDDQADVMANLADLYEQLGQSDKSRALHEQRLTLMEQDAARGKTPVAQRVHDYARMNSYLALGRGDEAVALLQKRVGQLPDDYEAHARLASTLHTLKRHDEALPVAEKAVALSYGPRRLRYLKLLADVRGAKGDVAGKRAALVELLKANDALPERMRLHDVATAARAALDEK